jgi:hypothetical protein
VAGVAPATMVLLLLLLLLLLLMLLLLLLLLLLLMMHLQSCSFCKDGETRNGHFDNFSRPHVQVSLLSSQHGQ